MLSPFTEKEMIVRKEWRDMTFRKETFKVCFHTWKCEDTGEEFEDEHFAQLNYNQVINQYREKYHIPYPDEIKSIRGKYDLSAIKMSHVLGFGDNTYRQYEAGEVPTQANARLIQMAADPSKFLDMIDLSSALEGSALEKARHNTEKLIDKVDMEEIVVRNYLFEGKRRGRFTGFGKPNFEKFVEMIIYFCINQQPWKTKLNKLLFYADFTFFKEYGISMSGSEYYAIDMGPVPDNFNSIFEHLAKTEQLKVYNKAFSNGGEGQKYFPVREFNDKLFEEAELEILQSINDKFKDFSTQEMIDLSHEEIGWQQNSDNPHRPIDYLYAFELKN